MQPIKKEFGRQQDPLVMNYKQKKGPENELPDHLHEWFEIVYVHEGRGTFFIHHTLYEMKQGDLFVVPANTIHRAILEREGAITVTALFFQAGLLLQKLHDNDTYQPIQLFQAVRKKAQYHIPLAAEQQVAVEQYMDAIHNEFAGHSVGYKSAAVLLLQLLLVMLSRFAQASYAANAAAPTSGPGWMMDVLQHIELHKEQQWNLAKLAKLANVTPAHFSRVFKQWTGMNVSQYLIMKRIIAAKQLLAATDEKLSLIAEKCGFESIPHFHRSFKKMTALTPTEYRNLQR
ncbi:hypothetical protein J40TS1_23230 [Paenibacillus montaniterrae]|uniref:HTH araC/xylS-type domain-containing protein n=1 Tax=Paenibacillus montaniterrae TaxID=429341 RepID=A0A919YQW6_9BACL|nr:AraC family transcriptional regulator [Paenibacillus montaniterrae]GIP16681.1 hypothetical protein J40TS1_23230 [Paenibacillus montaniterrae]